MIRQIFWLFVSPLSNRVQTYLDSLYDDYAESLKDIAAEWDEPWP
jgi:hypothetical protein